LIRKLRGSVLPKNFFGDNFQTQHADTNVTLPSAREPKRRFIPSKWEAKLVLRIIRSLRKNPDARLETNKEEDAPKLLWEGTDNSKAYAHALAYLPAPKVTAPSHEDSYNPPFEYRQDLTQDAHEDAQKIASGTRRFYEALRRVPSYSPFIVERFQRCLDLYLCPRVAKSRLKIQPSDMLPSLPSPKELKPYPSSRCLKYLGHSDKVLSISVDPSGQWLLSGSLDCSLRKWEVTTGRCLRKWYFGAAVKCVEWCPLPESNIILACVGTSVVVLNAEKELSANFSHCASAEVQTADTFSSTWEDYKGSVFIRHKSLVSKVTWHQKGDYFASLAAGGMNITIHRLTKKSSQRIFRQQKIAVQSVLFHPVRPVLFICTRSHVYLYDLQRQRLVKKLFNGGQTISCVAVHGGGDNIITGDGDGKLAWFDMDLSNMPYKVMVSHSSAIRRVAFHKNFPLFATVSDDATVHVLHGTVHSELNQNALIVPLRILRAHAPYDCEGVLDCVFHPTQPWLFSAGADKSIFLFCDGT
jgi:ribosome biogenesis protein ERB1